MGTNHSHQVLNNKICKELLWREAELEQVSDKGEVGVASCALDIGIRIPESDPITNSGERL
jgi:hypothetical protein